KLLHDLAAGRLEGQLESACALVAIGEILGNDRDPLVAERPGRVVAEGISHLRRRTEGMKDPRVYRMALEIDGSGRGRCDEWYSCFANISVDRQGLAGRQGADHDWHVITFDQLLGLGLGKGRVAGRILGDQLDLATGHGAVALFEEKGGAFLLLLAAGGKRASFDSEESNAKWLRGLRQYPPRRENADRCSAREQRAARYRKSAVPA